MCTSGSQNLTHCDADMTYIFSWSCRIVYLPSGLAKRLLQNHPDLFVIFIFSKKLKNNKKLKGFRHLNRTLGSGRKL